LAATSASNQGMNQHIQGFLEKIDIAIRTGLAKAPKVTFYL
jgi:hypothetical protein